MSMVQINSRDYFRMNLITYVAIILGQVVLGCVGLLMKFMNLNGLAFGHMRDTMLWIVPIIVGIGFLASTFFFNKLKDAAKAKPNLLQKMSRYRTALIARYGILEVGSIAAGISFLMTADMIFLGMLLLNIACSLVLRPTKESAIKDLDLDPSEVKMINDPEAIVAEMKAQ